MCEFCLKHGEGEKWYLQAKHYAEDLLADIRRRKFIEHFFSHPEALGKSFEDLRRLDKAPRFIRGMVGRLVTRRMKQVHFGQVVPIEHEQEGLCHTLWTFHTPFIGGVCNCDRSDCLAMRATVSHEIPVMFRAEYVAGVKPEACTGCRECMRVCQFGAVSYSAAARKAVIDPRGCYGCGICRSVCRQNAIRLEDRSAVPAAARRW